MCRNLRGHEVSRERPGTLALILRPIANRGSTGAAVTTLKGRYRGSDIAT